ncbi:hypothetical protein LIER_02334 [Lithospermum erythrorhizon]|uniref:SANT domain-containing protein n=1 Tax=Lithospermum erythrorhizon TaxID=34254 RepID=A0AAV3NP16_LITER
MPSEPYTWDRRDFRNHEGGGWGYCGPRWRENSFNHRYNNNNNNYSYGGGYNNYYGGGGGGGGSTRYAPYRAFSGHSKQGSRHLYPDEFRHGSMPSRPNEKMLEDGSCRPSGSWRYDRYSREYRGSSVQKDWKVHSSEITSRPYGSGRLNNTSDKSSADVMPSHNSSTPYSDSIKSRDQSLSKYQHENNGIFGSFGSTGQKLERDNSLNPISWKPLKWARSGSLSVRNSGISHSSSSKSMEPDISEMESMQKNVVPVLSPRRSGAATSSAGISNGAAEETNSPKKPRPGWGEGLAKYEKIKVESSDELGKNAAIICGSTLEPLHSCASNLSGKSPKCDMVSNYASPATPSSLSCSSSPAHLSFPWYRVIYLLFYFMPTDLEAKKLTKLDLTSISHLNSCIEELLQSDFPTVDSSFVKSTAVNKLLLLKNNISKAVETAETEIELLENELKTIISELERCDNHICASSSVPVACHSNPYEDHSGASKAVQRPAGLHVVVDSNVASNDDHLVVEDADVDSPGSATSNSIEVSLSKDVSPPEMLREIEDSEDPDLSMSNLEMEPEMDHLAKGKPDGVSSGGIDSELVTSVSSSNDSLDFCKEEFSHELVLPSKRDCKQLASEVIHKLLPSNGYNFDFSSVVESSCVQDGFVKERFLRKKYYYKVKEKIVSLKFKLLRHLWKEDMQILYLKKLRGKTQKKFDFSSWKLNNSYKKHFPSIRSRCSPTGKEPYASLYAPSPVAGCGSDLSRSTVPLSLSLAASAELLSYARRLLAEPQIKPLRSALKMPPMIIDRQEKMEPRFISYNGMVEDPIAVEKERSIFNPWSQEEKELLIDKLAEFGKDFTLISSFLELKTTTDCIEFYYKNHKSDAFKRAKNKPEFSKRSTIYMVSSRSIRNSEANAVSLDILGAASASDADINSWVEIQQKHTSKSLSVSGSCKMESGGDNLVDRSSSLCLENSEREAVAADVLAGICGSLSSEAMSSCITSSLDPGEGYPDQKYRRMRSSTRPPLTPDVTQNVVETYSDDSCVDMDTTYWTDEEKTLLIQAVSSYGKDFIMISRCVGTKTQNQCKVFFSKARKCLGLDKICSGTESQITDDDNRGRSDACFLETLGHDAMKVSIAPVKPDLNGAQQIVVGDAHTFTSKNSLPDDQGMVDNFELALDGCDGSRNSTEVVSNLYVAHGVGPANVENLPYLVETEDNALVFDGSHGNVSSTEVVSDLDVADDVGQPCPKNLPKVLETETRSRRLSAACRVLPDAKPDVESCSCESNLTANPLETKETCTSCSWHDEHLGVHLAGSAFMKQTLDLGVEEKPLVLEQSRSELVDPGSSITTTKHGKCLYDNALVVPEKMMDEQRMKYHRMDEHHFPRISLLDQMQSTCKVEQCPIAISTINEMSSDASCEWLIPEDANVAKYLDQDFHLQRCHSKKAVSSDADLAYVPHEGDPSGSQLHINKLSTNEDVKLFGQILSKTSQHKPNMSARLSEDCSSQHHSLASMKCSGNQQAVGVLSSHMKHGHNNIMHLDNLPPRNIGFRDQNRIPNGSSTLPESTILLARYPTAFSNYVPPSSKMEFPSLNTAKSVECSLNGVTTFSNKDVSANNGSSDLHMYQNQEVQSFPLGMRGRHDHLLAQMQRRNGFDVVPDVVPASGV